MPVQPAMTPSDEPVMQPVNGYVSCYQEVRMNTSGPKYTHRACEIAPKDSGLFDVVIRGSKQTKLYVESTSSGPGYSFFNFPTGGGEVYAYCLVNGDRMKWEEYAEPNETISIEISAPCAHYEGLFPATGLTVLTDKWEIQLDETCTYTGVQLVGAAQIAAEFEAMPFQCKRKWGQTRPGEAYPAVQGPGNPEWELLHPQNNPEGYTRVILQEGEQHVFSRQENGSIGTAFELENLGGDANLEVGRVWEDLGDSAPIRCGASTTKTWKVTALSEGTGTLRMKRIYRGCEDQRADFTILVIKAAQLPSVLAADLERINADLSILEVD